MILASALTRRLPERIPCPIAHGNGKYGAVFLECAGRERQRSRFFVKAGHVYASEDVVTRCFLPAAGHQCAAPGN